MSPVPQRAPLRHGDPTEASALASMDFYLRSAVGVGLPGRVGTEDGLVDKVEPQTDTPAATHKYPTHSGNL